MTTATYAYMSVDYTEGLERQATRDSYKGVRLDVHYGRNDGPDGDGARIIETSRFATGNFVADYSAAVNFLLGLPGVVDEAGDVTIPFMGSSSVDSYQFESGEEVA